MRNNSSDDDERRKRPRVEEPVIRLFDAVSTKVCRSVVDSIRDTFGIAIREHMEEKENYIKSCMENYVENVKTAINAEMKALHKATVEKISQVNESLANQIVLLRSLNNHPPNDTLIYNVVAVSPFAANVPLLNGLGALMDLIVQSTATDIIVRPWFGYRGVRLASNAATFFSYIKPNDTLTVTLPNWPDKPFDTLPIGWKQVNAECRDECGFTRYKVTLTRGDHINSASFCTTCGSMVDSLGPDVVTACPEIGDNINDLRIVEDQPAGIPLLIDTPRVFDRKLGLKTNAENRRKPQPYTSLRHLVHLAIVDVIAIVTAVTQCSKTRPPYPKALQVSIDLADPSISLYFPLQVSSPNIGVSAGFTAHILFPEQEQPPVFTIGDVVVLHRFRVNRKDSYRGCPKLLYDLVPNSTSSVKCFSIEELSKPHRDPEDRLLGALRTQMSDPAEQTPCAQRIINKRDRLRDWEARGNITLEEVPVPYWRSKRFLKETSSWENERSDSVPTERQWETIRLHAAWAADQLAVYRCFASDVLVPLIMLPYSKLTYADFISTIAGKDDSSLILEDVEPSITRNNSSSPAVESSIARNNSSSPAVERSTARLSYGNTDWNMYCRQLKVGDVVRIRNGQIKKSNIIELVVNSRVIKLPKSLIKYSNNPTLCVETLENV